jgi:hypothetical protein
MHLTGELAGGMLAAIEHACSGFVAQLPALPYWLSLNCWWVIGSFLISVWLGVFGVKDAMSKGHAITLAVALAGLSLLGWFSLAKQNEENARQSAMLAAMNSTQGKIQQSVLNIKNCPVLNCPGVTRQPIAPSIVQPAQHADIEVDSFTWGKSDQNKTANSFTVNTTYSNSGGDGTAPYRVTYSYVASDDLTSEQIEPIFAATLSKALEMQRSVPLEKDRSVMKHGESGWISDFPSLSDDQVALLNSGKGWFFLFEVLTYTDANTPRGHFWVSEFCGARMPNGNLQKCGVHNRNYEK